MPNSRQESFIDRYSDFAIAVSEATGVAPEVVLGQTALETGWGKSVAGGNMFGIKGAGQSVVTHEDIPGLGMVKSTESFRAYNNPFDSFADYGNLMNTDRYAGVRNAGTVDDQIAAIGRSGYATDRNYANKLGSVVDTIQNSRTFQNKVVDSVAALPAAPTDIFSGVGVPIGQVDFLGAVPDISPKPPSGGFSFGGFDLADVSLPSDLSFDMAPEVTDGPFADITANTAFDPRTSFSPVEAAAPNFSDVSLNTYPDITADLYSAPAPAPQEAAPPSPGFSAGFDEGPWGQTPDFNAPSLEARNNFDRQMGVVEGFNGNAWNSSDLNPDAIAASLNGQFGNAPQLATPSLDVNAIPQGDWSAAPTMAAAPSFAQSSAPAPSFPQSAPVPPSRPDFSLPSAPAPSFTDSVIDGLGLTGTVNSVKSGLHDMFGSSTDFVNAMSNPSIAQNYSPGLFDGWTGGALTGAAMGALTGGPFGALTGGVMGGLNLGGRLGDIASQQLGNFWDAVNFGLNPSDMVRSPTMDTGYGGAPGGLGDGSFSEHSGYNENNPQGIL